MFTADKVTEIFFIADEFNKFYYRMLEKYGLKAPKCQERGHITVMAAFPWLRS